MKTLVITGSTPMMWEVLDVSLPPKYSYVQKHGYDIWVIRHWERFSKYHFLKHEENYMQKILGFLRPLVCFEMLEFYDIVMWIDADSTITNSEYKLEDITKDDHCFYASYDWVWDRSFSTGNFILKKNENSQMFFEGFLETSKHFEDHSFQEQMTFNTMAGDSRYSNLIKTLDHDILNSVPKCIEETNSWINRDPIFKPWSENSFIAHITGSSYQDRIDIMKNKLTYK
jgi:hypothetical protein